MAIINTLRDFKAASATERSKVNRPELFLLLTKVIDSPHFNLNIIEPSLDDTQPTTTNSLENNCHISTIISVQQKHIQSLESQVQHLTDDAKSKSEIIKCLVNDKDRKNNNNRRQNRPTNTPKATTNESIPVK